MPKTPEQKVLDLAKKLVKELDKAGYKYQGRNLGHIDIWTDLDEGTPLIVESITHSWQIKKEG